MLLVLKRQNQLDAILAQGGSVILMSHLGSKVEEKYSLKHILKTTSDVLGKAVSLFQTVLVRKQKMLLQNYKLEKFMLENLFIRKRKQGCCF
jgi:phosphoglycerate kinase